MTGDADPGGQTDKVCSRIFGESRRGRPSEGLEWSVEGRMEGIGACEVGKVDGGTACWAPVLVSGERGGPTRVRRVKRTSVLKGRCKRNFVEMPRMNRKDAIMQRRTNVNASMLVFMYTRVQSYMLTMWCAPDGAKNDASYICKFPGIVIDCCFPVELLAVILKECMSFAVAWRVMTHARKLSRHHLWKQISAIFWIQVSVRNGKNITNEKVSAPSLGCVCQPMETSQCLGGDTRAVFSRLGWA